MKIDVWLKGEIVAQADIDDDDADLVAPYRWYLCAPKKARATYARATINGKMEFMHRHLMKPPPELEINHLDRNGLNNRRANLEAVSHQENIRHGVEVALGRRLPGETVLGAAKRSLAEWLEANR